VLRPTPGELLVGIRRELKDQVLPALPSGSAARQLTAALHVLDKISRTWDLQHQYLEADNADMDSTLDNFARLAGHARQRLVSSSVQIPGVTDPALRALLAQNEALQTELDAFQLQWRDAGRQDDEIDKLSLALHARMASRAATAGGVSDDR
jgi:hypothetical protein